MSSQKILRGYNFDGTRSLMCSDAKILKEILNILEPLIIFGFCSESNLFVDAFSRKFFRRSKVNKPKQSMRMLPHLSLPCPIDDRVFFLVMISCLKSTYNRQTHRVIDLLSPSHLSPLLSGQDDPETAQWHVGLYIKKAFIKDDSAPALF